MLLVETEGMNNSYKDLSSYSNTNNGRAIKLLITGGVRQSPVNQHL
jgi:hypothetical protein